MILKAYSLTPFTARIILISAIVYFGMVANSYSQSQPPANHDLMSAEGYLESDQTYKAKAAFEAIAEESCGIQNSEEAAICTQAYKARIRIERKLGRNEEALKLGREAIDYLDQIDIPDEPYHRVRIYKLLVYDNLGLNRLSEASEWISIIREHIEGESNFRILAMSENILGYYEDTLGNFNEAIGHYIKGIELAEKMKPIDEISNLLLELHNNLGVSYMQIGELDKAKAEYEKSLVQINILNELDTYNEATALINLGGIYYSKGDIGLAAEYFQRSVVIFKSLNGDYSDSIGAALNNLAATQFMLGKYELSARYFEEAQRIKENNLGLDHPDTAVGYSNLAAIYIQNEDFKSARSNYVRSITVKENIYGSNHPNLIEPKLSLGNLYSYQLKQHKEARIQYESALSIVLDRLGESHPDVIYIYLQIGNSYLEEEMYHEAESYIDRALENLYGPYDFNESFDPERSVSDPIELIRALAIKSLLLTNRREEINTEDFEKSLMALRWASDLVDEVQRSFKSEASKLQLLENNYSIYTGTVEILATLYQETGKEEYKDQIFETIEKSRSRVTLELIQQVNAKKFAGVPPSIISREDSLSDKITQMQQEHYREENRGHEKDNLKMRALQDSIFYYKRNLDDFTDALEDEYPAYFNLKYDQSVISLADAQALLKSDEVAMSYVLGNDKAYVMVITKENVNLVELEGPAEIENLVLELKENVLAENSEAYRQAAHKLYELLIEPAEEFITEDKLIIMADQALHYLPFELLLKEIPDHNRFSRYPYIVHDYVFSYVPSLTLLEEMQTRLEDNPRNLLAVAPFSSEIDENDVAMMDHQYSDSANPLYLTQYETASISSQFRNKASLREYLNPQKAELLLGNDATFSQFSERDLTEYDYIHFATHAFINDENPEFSAILLYPEEENSGATYVGDIYNMKLDANLVVLGACQTGMGTIFKGEGLIGFTRAFIYAGASNLAVSMWRVSDQPTAYLMVDFYEQIRKGYDYSTALRQAKLNMISNPQFANPVNWAAFMLTGR